MEVADRTEADRKGGHLARRRGGGLVLREIAQCADEDRTPSRTSTRHRFFNTNNLWLNLRRARRGARRARGVLGLPMIVNRKTVDPRDPRSPRGDPARDRDGRGDRRASRARARCACRATRFAPVKTTNDLLVLRSDAYLLDERSRRARRPSERAPRRSADLDKRVYKLIDDFEARFPAGPPSLVACDR